MPTKICSKCNIDKPKTEYHKRSDRPIGVVGACKKCIAPKHREDKLKNFLEVNSKAGKTEI